MYSLFIFRRDLRLEDNTGLLAALKESKAVIPCFIFDPRQLEKNDYRSDAGVRFLIHSLQELDETLQTHGSRLHVFSGVAHEVLEKLFTTKKGDFFDHDIGAVYCNEDYTPFSKKRDENIKVVCEKYGKEFFSFSDALLTKPGSVLKDDGKPYTIFTPFYRKASKQEVFAPKENTYKNYAILLKGDDDSLFDFVLKQYGGVEKQTHGQNQDLLYGGRKEALALLDALPKDYARNRDIPLNMCSKLSAHHKFGTISIRESYKAGCIAYGSSSTFHQELYWRDFFAHIAHFFPHIFGHAFNARFENVAWSNDEELFRTWCEGRTGFPIVDAGMRELNETGFMHNRVRMIVASFLTKDLLIDWRLGEKYFAQKLQDYDPAINNGNWQWVASTGCDAQPYFRIFNPWLQQKRFDPDCLYIKRWVKELEGYSPLAIHSLATTRPLGISYPLPIVDHSVASKLAKEAFKQ